MQPEPDIILPSSFLPRTIATPEKRLLLAVLEEAVGTFQRHLLATDRRGRMAFVDVETWFASDDPTWLFSFVGICDALGIDPTYVRSGLRRWLDARRPRALGVAPPVYHFPFRRVGGARHRTTGRPQGLASGRGRSREHGPEPSKRALGEPRARGLPVGS